jgi:hypothetical protein
MATKKQIFGVLILVILSASIYIMLPEKVKIHVDNDKTSIYVWENAKWQLGGVEKNYLYNGTRMVTRISDSIFVNQSSSGNLVNITRYAKYRNGAEVWDIYSFDGAIDDVEQIPISHNIVIKGAKGLFYRYVASSLTGYPGKLKLNGTEYNFGHNIKIQWQSGYNWAWLDYPSKGLNVQYKVNSNLETFQIRMFDPIVYQNFCYQEFSNLSTACGGLAGGSYTNTGGWTDATNFSDGDWDTFTYSDGASGRRIYSYYELPLNADLTTSFLQVKTNVSTVNITLGSRLYNSSHVQIRMFDGSDPDSGKVGQCNNAGSCDFIYDFEVKVMKWYEEAIYWNMTTYINVNLTAPANASTLGEGDIVFYYTVNSSNSLANCSLYMNRSTGIIGMCYQESANVSTACGGLATGSYTNSSNWQPDGIPPDNNNVSMCYDEDWNTFGIGSQQNQYYELYINYSKPLYSLNTSLFQIKLNFPAYPGTIYNLSLAPCWNAYSDKIVINFSGIQYTGNYNKIEVYCRNTSISWYLLIKNTTDYAGGGLWEEAVWWNISESSWVINKTNDYSEQTQDNGNFTISLQEGSYLWNVLCSDVFGNSSWGHLGNYTLNIGFSNTIDCSINPVTTSELDVSEQEIQANGVGTWTIEAEVKGKNLSKDNNCNISIKNGAGNLTLG